MPSSRVLPAFALPAAALALAAAAGPALAQAPERAGPPAGLRDDGGDRLTIGFGLGAAPDYEGSNDYRLQPGGIERNRFASDFGIIALPTMILVDGQGKVITRSLRSAAELERQLEKSLAARQPGVALDR